MDNYQHIARLLSLLSLFIIIFGYCSSGKNADRSSDTASEPVYDLRAISDSMFGSRQVISLLTLNKASSNRYGIDIGYQTGELLETSQIAAYARAVAAINGGFFDMDSGGSVSYFEMNDSVISRSRPAGLKWAVPDSLVNAALLLDKNSILKIEAVKTEQFYEASDSEAFVLVSGPLLIKDSQSQKLPDMSFSHKRHPRTCLGITKESILLITIDGRSELADGMSLFEVQKYLLGLGCIDAINLDGGGSTCMWTKSKGVVNIPSDKTGERPVANAILILEK